MSIAFHMLQDETKEKERNIEILHERKFEERKSGEICRNDIVFHEKEGFGEVVMLQPPYAWVEYVRQGVPVQKRVLLQELELIAPVECRLDRR